jgi:hypothetical protein
MPRQAQGRPWGCGGGVTVLDAVERWCLHVMRMVQSCSDSDRDTISDLSEMSGLKRCKLKLRVTTFNCAPCHDLQAVRSEGSSVLWL